jgi:hypothetical protein
LDTISAATVKYRTQGLAVMHDKLETIATFWNPGEANLARGHLEAEGISTLLANEEHVAATWLIANALGGIKLQVAQRDADRARACLADVQSITGHELDEAAMTAIDDAHEDSGSADTADGDDEITLSLREQHAERAWRGAVMGLIFLPLQLYVFYLLVKVFLSDDLLRRRHRRHVWFAVVINLPFVIGFCIFLRAMMAD